MTQLASAVDAADKLWTLDTLPSSPYLQVDDELVEIRASFPEHIRQSTQEVRPPQIRVIRGIAGSTAASHAEAALVQPIYAPSLEGATEQVVLLYGPYSITYQTPNVVVEDPDGTEPGVLLDADVTVPAGAFVRFFLRRTTAFVGWDAIAVNAILQASDGATGVMIGGVNATSVTSSDALTASPALGTLRLTLADTRLAVIVNITTAGGGTGPLTAGAADIWFEVMVPSESG